MTQMGYPTLPVPLRYTIILSIITREIVYNSQEPYDEKPEACEKGELLPVFFPGLLAQAELLRRVREQLRYW